MEKKIEDLEKANKDLIVQDQRHQGIKLGYDKEINDWADRLERANKRSIERDDEIVPLRTKLQDSLDRARQMARDLKET